MREKERERGRERERENILGKDRPQQNSHDW